MSEGEPPKETISRGELFYLWHPETEKTFSGYGLTAEPGRKDLLVGLLMVDRPQPADPAWLQAVKDTFGECRLMTMTAEGERGLACQMQVETNSTPHVRRLSSSVSGSIQRALEPFLEQPPVPVLNLRWDEESQLWLSEFAGTNELPREICEVFETTGYGCLAAETNIGVVHVCHASDTDIKGFANQPVRSRWQLIKMHNAPLIRLELVILDRPENPYRFESFLNVAAEDQARVLARLANQDHLYLAFYDDKLDYRYTMVLPHDEQQWQQLDELWQKAVVYWEALPADQRDFDLAKVEFMGKVE